MIRIMDHWKLPIRKHHTLHLWRLPEKGRESYGYHVASQRISKINSWHVERFMLSDDSLAQEMDFANASLQIPSIFLDSFTSWILSAWHHRKIYIFHNKYHIFYVTYFDANLPWDISLPKDTYLIAISIILLTHNIL